MRSDRVLGGLSVPFYGVPFWSLETSKDVGKACGKSWTVKGWEELVRYLMQVFMSR